jgi:hypothetical protein
MKTCKIIFAIFLLSPALFLGCGSSNTGVGEAATASLRKADSQRGEAGGVVRETPTPPAQKTLGEHKTIATRLGPYGLEVDLTRIGFTGDLMTVEMRVRNPSNKAATLRGFRLDKVSFIDDATSRRYSMVKDQSGNYMASPTDGEYIPNQDIDGGGYSLIWFKFPAPPSTTQTISITIPGVNPFDGIRLEHRD